MEKERIVECRLWHPFPCVLMVGLLWTISSKADIYAQLALFREGEGKKTEVSGCVGKEIWLALSYILSLRKDQKVFRRVMARTGFSTRKIYFCVWLCYVQLSHGILWTHCGRWCFNILQFLQHLKLFFIYIKSIFINLVKTEVFLLLLTFTAYNPSMSSRG